MGRSEQSNAVSVRGGDRAATEPLAESTPGAGRQDLWRRLFFWLLPAIVLAGAYLRFAGLGDPSLWLDEILHVHFTTEAAAQPWTAWLTGFDFEVENGPLFFGSQLAARHLAHGETAVRLAPAVWGTLTIAVLGLAGRALGGPVLGLVAAALLAASPFHVFYSREGRVYALLMLVAAVLLFVFLRRRTAGTVPLAVAVCLAAAYTGAISGPLLVAAAGSAALLLARALWRRRAGRPAALPQRGEVRCAGALLAASLVGLALLATLYLLGSQHYVPEAGTERGETPNVIEVLSRTSFERLANALCCSGHDAARLPPRASLFFFVAAVGFWAAFRRDAAAGIALAGLCGLTLAVALGALYYLNHWFLIRYLSAAVPAFVLALAAGTCALAEGLGRRLGRVAPRRFAGAWEPVLLLVLLAALILPSVATARVEPYQRADWRHAARLIEGLAVPGDRIVASNSWSEICLGHYLGRTEDPPPILEAGQKTEVAQRMAEEEGSAWLIAGGYHGRTNIREWMRSAHAVWTTPIEELGLYYYPDFAAFVRTRAAGCPGCSALFKGELGGRFEFDGRAAFLQGDGWWPPERQADGVTFQWIDGRSAELALPGAGAVEHEIRFRAMPLGYPGAPPQEVTLRLDGEPVGERIVLGLGWHEVRVAVAARHWRQGLHLLRFELAHAAAPRAVIDGALDARELGLALDFLELRPTATASAADVDAEVEGDVDAAAQRLGRGRAALLALPYAGWDADADAGQSGVVVHDEARAWPGLNLYTNDVDRAYLTDMSGRRLHTWRLPRGLRHCEHVEPLAAGEVLVVCVGQGLVKLDWDSRVLWRRRLNAHHDVAVDRDGTLWLPVAEAPRPYRGRQVKFDALAHLSPQGELLETWSTYDHLGALQRLHPPLPLDRPPVAAETETFDYYHLNSVEVLPPTPLGEEDRRFRAGNLLICSRNTGLVAVLDQETREVVWHWGPGVLSGPHMPTLVDDGRVLVFDNGTERDFSRVLEVDPRTGEVVWRYQAEPPEAFFSPWRGSAQRLPNGNTLIAESEKGRVFEVTRDGTVVWELWNPEMRKGERRRIYRFTRLARERLRGAR